MLATGVDLFLDIHGDETLPYVFVDGNGMVPGFTAEQAEQESASAKHCVQPARTSRRRRATRRTASATNC
jgi:hypothetical protein